MDLKKKPEPLEDEMLENLEMLMNMDVFENEEDLEILETLDEDEDAPDEPS